MFHFHINRKLYFDIQFMNAEKFVIPFIEKKTSLIQGMRVLEIGCGEAGVLKAFVNRGCIGVGIEPDVTRVDNANLWLQKDIAAGKITLIPKDIYQVNPDEIALFNLIILKDVIEHIHDQQKLIRYIKTLLKPGGFIFFGFPPWQMPFGGHQQICRHKITSRTPYYHLLPRYLYQAILRKYNEPVEELLEIRDMGISIERFEKIVTGNKYHILHKTFFIINPIYEWKFGWKTKKQFFLLGNIPVIRNFFTSCAYYLITPVDNDS